MSQEAKIEAVANAAAEAIDSSLWKNILTELVSKVGPLIGNAILDFILSKLKS